MAEQPATTSGMLARVTAPVRYLRGRLFRRLLLIALPGVVAVLIVLGAATLISNQMTSQAREIRRAVLAREYAIRLENHLEDFITTADWMTAANGRYSAAVALAYRNRLAVDGTTLKDLDISSFPGSNGPAAETQKMTLLSHFDTLLQDLKGLDAAATSNPSAATALWANTLRARVTDFETELQAVANDWDVKGGTAIDQSVDFSNLSQWGILALTLGAILICALVAILLTTSIMRPVERLK
jgi:hypothetical protein